MSETKKKPVYVVNHCIFHITSTYNPLQVCEGVVLSTDHSSGDYPVSAFRLIKCANYLYLSLSWLAHVTDQELFENFSIFFFIISLLMISDCFVFRIFAFFLVI